MGIHKLFKRILRRLRRRPVIWGNTRRLKPFSNSYGFDRGKPVDRYYIEKFLQGYSNDIYGTCLEILDCTYTNRFGNDRVKRCDVLDIDENNPKANIISDIQDVSIVADNTYDCLVVTQMIQFLPSPEKAVKEAFRMLKPGGVLLTTAPCLSKIDPIAGVDNDYWRFTQASAKKVFGSVFGEENTEVHMYGNLLLCIAFLQGLAQCDIKQNEFDYYDPDFPLLVCVKAKKPL